MAVMHVEFIGLARLRTSKTSVDVEVPDASVASLILALAKMCPTLVPDVLTPEPPGFVGGHGILEYAAVILEPSTRLTSTHVILLTLPAGG